jgi:uncharacterized protein YbaP (TraB family)
LYTILGMLIRFLFLLSIPLSWGQTVDTEHQLLWEISGHGLKQNSYLYGSLHLNDKRLFRFSDTVYAALERVEAVVLETDVFSLFENWDTRKEELKILFDNQGMPYTGSNKASKTLYGNEDGMPQFLDAYLQEYAYNAGKKFYPLEKVEDQLNIASNWIKPELNEVAGIAYELTQERLIDFYLKGDIHSLERVMRTSMELYPGMYEDMIVNRNEVMVRGLDSLLAMGSLFCAVGAGHLGGDKGIIQLLRKKGYRVRKVTAVYSELAILEKTKVRSFRTYTYKNDSLGLVAVFPGKPVELKIWDNHPYLLYREMGQGNTYSVEVVKNEPYASFEEQAEVYIASPDGSSYMHRFLDDGTEVFEGLSDTYPDGLHWVRLMRNDTHLVIMRAFGGNKFMLSNRPNQFFSKVWFE